MSHGERDKSLTITWSKPSKLLLRVFPLYICRSSKLNLLLEGQLPIEGPEDQKCIFDRGLVLTMIESAKLVR
jgi:hypothetical protein